MIVDLCRETRRVSFVDKIQDQDALQVEQSIGLIVHDTPMPNR